MKKYIVSFSIILLTVGCSHTVKTLPEAISADNAPKPIAPYSQAILIGDTLYISGHIGSDPQSGRLVADDVQAQKKQAMENLQAVLQAAGFSMDDVVATQVFLSDLDDYAAMNEVYAQFFHGAYPSRAVVEVSRIPKNALVEIKMIAVKSK